jgi:hypothetical protein
MTDAATHPKDIRHLERLKRAPKKAKMITNAKECGKDCGGHFDSPMHTGLSWAQE